MRLIAISAFSTIVNRFMNAMILPISVVPLLTRTAPAAMTATMPRFRSRLMTGLISAIVFSAVRSFSVRSSLTRLKRSRSYADFESALMTRMPVAFSRTTRSMASEAFCTMRKSRAPLRET